VWRKVEIPGPCGGCGKPVGRTIGEEGFGSYVRCPKCDE